MTTRFAAAIVAACFLLPLTNANTLPQNFIDCLSEKSVADCASRRVNEVVDAMQNAGGPSDVPVSKVIEETSYLIAEGVSTIYGTRRFDGTDSDVESDRGLGGKNKLHLHKRKKVLKRLFMLGMILKSKISLLFQLLSAHFQVKFFIVAVLGLIINAARFWLDLKKAFHPSKVIYYEHAQHQHHYDHDDDHGYWGRSFNDNPSQLLAYRAYVPKS